MSGLPDIALNIPQQYDPEWMRIFIRDVLSLADSRNSTGVGIIVSGESGEKATYEIDSQNVDVSEGLETRSIVAVLRARIDELEISAQHDKLALIGMRQRIEELEKDAA